MVALQGTNDFETSQIVRDAYIHAVESMTDFVCNLHDNRMDITNPVAQFLYDIVEVD